MEGFDPITLGFVASRDIISNSWVRIHKRRFWSNGSMFG